MGEDRQADAGAAPQTAGRDAPPGRGTQSSSEPADFPRGEPAGSTRGLVVAIDGPGSSGKSSVGAAAAQAVGYRFCDTGLLYRAVTWLALQTGGPLDDPDRLVPLVGRVTLTADEAGRLVRVFVDGREVTGRVRVASVDTRVSEVARVPAVRRALLDAQRALAAPGGIVMAGRDIGTVVLPDADLKLYLDASVEARARRRARERGLDPEGPEAREILDQLRSRDRVDTTRPVAPLALAPDAIRVVTDDLDFTQTVERVVAAIRSAQRERTDRSLGGASRASPSP
jgi:cytidylate kinase